MVQTPVAPLISHSLSRVVHNTMRESLANSSSSAQLDQKFGALFPDLYEHFALETAWRQYNGISSLLQVPLY
jgi:hypothetical protein